MGIREQYDARKAAEARRAQDNQPTPLWWLGQRDPIARFTKWLVAFTALLFIATVANAIILLITDFTLKGTLEANNRAWIAPSGALLNGNPIVSLNVGQNIDPTLLYRNSGQSPALNLSSAMEMILLDSPGGTANFGPSNICQRTAPGEGALFPMNPIPISFPADAPKVQFTDAINNLEKIVLWQGCFRYETYGKARKTEFCFWLRKNGPQWYWHECGTKAD